MKANEKEYQCIEISRIYRNQVVKNKLSKHKEDKLPLLMTPLDFEKHFNTDFKEIMRTNPIW